MDAPRSDAGGGAASELAGLYARLDAELEARRPRCDLSGRCCDFPTSGHRLYATDLETAHAVAAAGGAAPAAASGSCPWHVDGLCRNRAGRPLGCRVYFCDPGWAAEMPDVYERYHAELRALHDRHGLPYRYRLFVDAARDEVTP